MTYTGRLAPSPTGFLHLGHAATFLAAGDRAEDAGGQLLLRVDDLDPQRSKAQYVEAAREDLSWLGLRWQAEYRQSARLSLYRAAMHSLLEQGAAYPCTCTRKDLQAATQAPHEETEDEPLYNGRCRPLASITLYGGSCRSEFSPAAATEFEPGTNYRFCCPDRQEVSFVDGNFGKQCFTSGIDFGDFLIWRKDGLPSYQLASVVDDHNLGITEVVRGRDLQKSTARQILLQQALGLRSPAYFHTELLHDTEGRRLAKRHDALSLRALRDAGATAGEIRARVEDLLHHRKA